MQCSCFKIIKAKVKINDESAVTIDVYMIYDKFVITIGIPEKYSDWGGLQYSKISMLKKEKKIEKVISFLREELKDTNISCLYRSS